MSLILSFLTSLLFGFLATWVFEFILTHDRLLNRKFWKHHIPIFGYHVHHSTYGLLFFCLATLASISFPDKTFALVGIGWGIIIRHTVTDRRFVFIEKMH